MGILTCLIWSSSVFITEKLSKGFGPIFGVGVELLIAGFVFLLITILRGDFNKILLNNRKYFTYCSLFWLANVIFSWIGLSLCKNDNETIIAGLVNYLWPSLTILFSLPILKNIASPYLILGLAFSVFGVIFAKFTYYDAPEMFADINYLAYFVMLLDALAWALYSNLAKKYATPSAVGAVPLFMLAGGAILLGYSLIYQDLPSPNLSMITTMCIWAVLNGFSYLGWDYAMRFGNMILVTVVSMLIPLLSTLITAYMNSSPINIELIASSSMVVIGAFICRKSVREKEA